MAYANPTAGNRRSTTTGVAIPSVVTADANSTTYSATTATLINELKVQLNAALAALRSAGIIDP